MSNMYGGELGAAVMLVIFTLCPPQAPRRSPLCRWLRLCGLWLQRCCYACCMTGITKYAVSKIPYVRAEERSPSGPEPRHTEGRISVNNM